MPTAQINKAKKLVSATVESKMLYKCMGSWKDNLGETGQALKHRSRIANRMSLLSAALLSNLMKCRQPKSKKAKKLVSATMAALFPHAMG